MTKLSVNQSQKNVCLHMATDVSPILLSFNDPNISVVQKDIYENHDMFYAMKTNDFNSKWM